MGDWAWTLRSVELLREEFRSIIQQIQPMEPYNDPVWG